MAKDRETPCKYYPRARVRHLNMKKQKSPNGTNNKHEKVPTMYQANNYMT